jgi:hypothetical protein
VSEILSTSNVLPKTSVGITADAAALVAGSSAQDALKQMLRTDMAFALSIDPTEIDISGLKALAESGRRRLQSTSVQFDFIILAPNASTILADFTAQLSSPNSKLRQSTTAGTIDASSLSFTFECAQGLYRPEGSKNCLPCPGNSIPNVDTNYASCKECGLREAPDPQKPWNCVCEPRSFNTSRAPSCHAADYSPSKVKKVWPIVKCESCDTLDCAGNIVECPGGTGLSVDPGYILMANEGGYDTIFQCDNDFACPGGIFQPLSSSNGTICGPGHTGLACAVCEDKYEMKDGECSSCEDMGYWGIVQLVGIIVLLTVVATQVRKWFKFTVIGEAGEALQEIKAIAKIFVSTWQIIGGLANVLSIDFPKQFRDFLSKFVSAFRFDFTVNFGLGCLAEGGYILSVMANIGAVILVLLTLMVIHTFRMRAIAKGETSAKKKKVVMRAIFDKFDDGGTGIELAAMQRICKKLDPNMTGNHATSSIINRVFARSRYSLILHTIAVEQVAMVFNKADADGGGTIDFNEFYTAVEATDASELHIGDIVDKARRTDINAATMGSVFLLSFLLYPRYTHIYSLFSDHACVHNFTPLPPNSLTGKIFDAFLCRDFGYGQQALLADYRSENSFLNCAQNLPPCRVDALLCLSAN